MAVMWKITFIRVFLDGIYYNLDKADLILYDDIRGKKKDTFLIRVWSFCSFLFYIERNRKVKNEILVCVLKEKPKRKNRQFQLINI